MMKVGGNQKGDSSQVAAPPPALHPYSREVEEGEGDKEKIVVPISRKAEFPEHSLSLVF